MCRPATASPCASVTSEKHAPLFLDDERAGPVSAAIFVPTSTFETPHRAFEACLEVDHRSTGEGPFVGSFKRMSRFSPALLRMIGGSGHGT